MTFLALSPPQVLLLAVATAGAVVALYFLKPGHRRVLVASALLWQRVLAAHAAYSRREKLRTLASILLAATIALTMAFSIARPRIDSLAAPTKRTVIVLDTSPSMGARTADGHTRWQRAAERARRLIDDAAPDTEFRVVDTSGATAFPVTGDRAEARAFIDGMSPLGSRPRFPNVDPRDATVYFVSDGVGLPDVPAFVKPLSVFERAQNVAITAFDLRPVPANPLEYEGYLEVHNAGTATDVELAVGGNGEDSIHRSLRLAANETYKEVLDLSRLSGGVVEAYVHANGDALPLDDVGFAYLPSQRRMRVVLVTRGNSHLTTLLKSDRHVELQIVDPRAFHESAEADAYVFDRFAPPTAPSRPSLIIGSPTAGWLAESHGIVRKPEVTTWIQDHPVTRFLSLDDVSIERAAKIDPGNLTVLAASRETPLIVASTTPRWVMVTFELEASDFPLHPAFPVFVENVLAWFAGEPLALRRRAGDIVFPLPNAEVRASDGTIVPSHQRLGSTVARISAPGVYTAHRGDADVRVALQLADRSLSEINRTFFDGRPPATADRAPVRREPWFLMLVAAIVLLGAEWLAYHRRITL